MARLEKHISITTYSKLVAIVQLHVYTPSFLSLSLSLSLSSPLSLPLSPSPPPSLSLSLPPSLSPAPPVIIYTTEFVIRGQNDFGQAGQLTCTVQTSPDTGITVAWWVNGSKIDTEHSTKYRTEVVPMNPDDVMQYKLMIEDVQHPDIGSYLCQLSTAYRVEDSQEAWLQVDFRKG